MNYYSLINKLSKTTEYQNLFISSKELNGIKIFKNEYDFTKIQSYLISCLFIQESLNKDIIIDKVSPKILEDDIYQEAYLFWKRNKKSETKEDKPKSDLKLVPGKKITFPKR